MTDREQSFGQAAAPTAAAEGSGELLYISKPRFWMAQAGAGVLLLCLLLWSVFGRIPRKVDGDGILIRGDRLFKISALGGGVIQELRTKVGNVVTQGQVVAVLESPQLAEQIKNAQKRQAELTQQYAQLTTFENRDSVRAIELLALKKFNLTRLIRDHEEQSGWLQEKTGNQEKLLEQGLITRQTLLDTKQERYAILRGIEIARSELQQLLNEEHQLVGQKQQLLFASQYNLNEAARRLKELESDYALTTRVTSPQDGQILERQVKAGELIQPGTRLFTLEPIDADMVAVIYLDAEEGKLALPGMTAHVIPSSVRKELNGYMEGIIKSVAKFPATRQTMQSILENQMLVDTLSEEGSQITVYISLVRDKSTPTGYHWSSSKGPAIQISSGTLCTATIAVEQRRPIELAIPALKKFIGL